MPSITRRTLSIAAAAGVASTSHAQFIGIDLREDKSPPSAEGLDFFPGEDRVRIFNFYAMFAGPGAALGQPGEENVVLNVGTPNTGPAALYGFGVNIERNPNASFYRAPPVSGASADGIGGVDQALAGDNRREWSTFVSIGVKRFDSYYTMTGLPDSDATAFDAAFGILTRRSEPLMDRPPLQRHDWITGGWFNSMPPNVQGAAQDLGDGSFGVFLAQLAVMDLEEDADIGSGGVAMPYDFVPGATQSTWYGDVFISGDATSGGGFQPFLYPVIIFTQRPQGGAFANYFGFDIPTPGALALFAFAGAATSYRRRSRAM